MNFYHLKKLIAFPLLFLQSKCTLKVHILYFTVTKANYLMRKLLFLILFTFALIIEAHAQKVLLDGYVYEKYNRGFLNEVKIAVLDESEVLIGETMSDIDGHFTMEVPAGKDYFIDYSKKVFANKREKLSARGISAGERILVKLEMERQPGYLLEVTLAEKISEDMNARNLVRNLFEREGVVKTKLVKGKETEGAKYKDLEQEVNLDD